MAPQGGPTAGFGGPHGQGQGQGNSYGNQEGGGYGAGYQGSNQRGMQPAKQTSFQHAENPKARGGSFNDQNMDRDDGRIPADRMKRHVPVNPPLDEVDDMSSVAHGGNQKEKTHSMTQIPGGPASRAQVQPGTHNESMIVPALRNKKRIDPAYAGADDDPTGGVLPDDHAVSLQNAEEIKLADMNKAQPLIPHLSEPIVKGIFSHNWNIRDKAVQVMSQEVMKGSKSEM